jgi:hypothetical protein
MSASLDEHRLGSLRWIVLSGPDREAFGALGEHVRGELAALAEAWPALPRLRRHVSGRRAGIAWPRSAAPPRKPFPPSGPNWPRSRPGPGCRLATWRC